MSPSPRGEPHCLVLATQAASPHLDDRTDCSQIQTQATKRRLSVPNQDRVSSFLADTSPPPVPLLHHHTRHAAAESREFLRSVGVENAWISAKGEYPQRTSSCMLVVSVSNHLLARDQRGLAMTHLSPFPYCCKPLPHSAVPTVGPRVPLMLPSPMAHVRASAARAGAIPRSTACLLGLALIMLVLPRPAHAGGITIITHGHLDDSYGWVQEMALAIADRSDNPASVSIWRATLFDDPAQMTFVLVAGPNPWSDSSFNGEIILLLDWSYYTCWSCGPFVPTGDIADAVALRLLNLQPAPGERWISDSIHMIGHSRGASVNAALSRAFHDAGLWVDHFTALDPHPVDGEWLFDCLLGNPDWLDASVDASPNMVFAENYYRTDGLDGDCDVDGRPMTGAANVALPEDRLNGCGYLLEHSDTHLWYHGTVDLSASGDGYKTLCEDWYTSPYGPRDEVGFAWSRIAHGQPWTQLGSAGYHYALGGSASRPSWYWTSNAVWPNPFALVC